MKKIKVSDKFFVPHISAETIKKAVKEVAGRINNDYKDRDPLFISVLNGAFMFTSDLMKEITVDNNLTFIKVCSYCGIKSEGKVNPIMGLNEDIEGRDIILIDDIVDSGLTINELYAMMSELKPRSIAVAVFIFKPNCYKGGINIDYSGIVMQENNFIIGYGLDYDQKARNLPEIYILDEC